MRISVHIFRLVVGLVLIVTPAVAEDASILTVTGEGRATAAPDMATVALGVQQEARDAAVAMTAASDTARGILAALEAAGVAPADVQTTRIGLDPRYSRSNDAAPPKITGYVASNDLSVRVRDLAALGDILDSLISSGANSFRGLSFGVSEPTSLADQARTEAVLDARRRAERLAEAAGVALGPILSITEGGATPGPQPVMRSAMMAEASVPVAEGEIEVRARVTLVFRLAN